MAKATAGRTGQKLDINQQCLSEGLANLSGSFFQCFPGSGSLTRSAINMKARGIRVLLCGVRRDLAKVLQSTGLESRLGQLHVFQECAGTWSSTLDAIRFAYELLEREVCGTCPRRGLSPAEANNGWSYMI
jgi:hypothetical protein